MELFSCERPLTSQQHICNVWRDGWWWSISLRVRQTTALGFKGLEIMHFVTYRLNPLWHFWQTLARLWSPSQGCHSNSMSIQWYISLFDLWVFSDKLLRSTMKDLSLFYSALCHTKTITEVDFLFNVNTAVFYTMNMNGDHGLPQ